MNKAIPMIVLSPLAKGGGYNNTIRYDHGSLVRTIQEIFNAGPLLRNAANVPSLSDLFISGLVPTPTPETTATPLVTSAPTATPIATSTPVITPTPDPSEGISVRSSSTGDNGSGTKTLIIPAPASIQQGGVLVAQVVINSTSATVVAPAGWNLIQTAVSTGSIKQVSFYKLVTASEPTSYTWTFNSARAATGGITSFSGVDSTAPILASSAKYNDTTTTISFNQINVTVPNSMILALSAVSGKTTITPPAGFIESYDVKNNIATAGKTAELSRAIQLLPGTTNVGNAFEDTIKASNLAQIIVLKPAN